MRAIHLRGAATVELVLVSPLLVGLLWISVWLTELVRARFGLQEAVRALLWERAGAIPKRGWEEIRRSAEGRVRAKPPRRVGIRAFSVELTRTEIHIDLPPPLPPTPFTPRGGAIAGPFLARPPEALVEALGLRPEGALRASVFAEMDNPFPLIGLRGESDALEQAEFRAQETLWADDWHLEDGEDVGPVWQGKRLGGTTPGPELDSRVRGITYLGAAPVGGAALARVQALPLVPWALPALTGTFVVSLAYREASGQSLRFCGGIPGYGRAVPGRPGLRDFMAGPLWLDHDVPRCFDTTPFRDIHAYPRPGGSPGNLSMQLFNRRGPHFLGCRAAQAADPSSSLSTLHPCEVP